MKRWGIYGTKSLGEDEMSYWLVLPEIAYTVSFWFASMLDLPMLDDCAATFRCLEALLIAWTTVICSAEVSQGFLGWGRRCFWLDCSVSR